MTSRHTLSVLVQNTPGVLARVTGLFSRRCFDIESLHAGPTDDPATSRLVIVVAIEDRPLEQLTKQLNKLIDVLKIVELRAPDVAQPDRHARRGAVRRLDPHRDPARDTSPDQHRRAS